METTANAFRAAADKAQVVADAAQEKADSRSRAPSSVPCGSATINDHEIRLLAIENSLNLRQDGRLLEHTENLRKNDRFPEHTEDTR